MTFDIFSLLKTTSIEMPKLIIQFISDYWYGFLFLALMIFLFFLYIKKTDKPTSDNNIKLKPSKTILSVVIFLIFFIIGLRGGIQLKPITIVSAANYVKPSASPIILNSTFTIIKTLGKKSLSEHNFMPLQQALSLYYPFFPDNNISKKTIDIVKPAKYNILLIIVESLSASHIAALNQYSFKSYTPYLDSIISVSAVFTRCYANAKRSIEALPAILSSIPALMETPYVNSEFVDNKTTSIPQLLNENGYTTMFFHGGKNGTMQFDSYSAKTGIKYYYGLNEYPNNKEDYDGTWGIFDEQFLQFAAQKISQHRQPFFAVIYTLSSHHPYKIPQKYKATFMNNTPLQQSIQYTDMAIAKFFDKVKKSNWYDNTIFIITADHTSEQNNNNATIDNTFRIPLIIFGKSVKPHHDTTTITQHIDIMPLIADVVGVNNSFFCLGKSPLNYNKNKNFAISYLNGNYYCFLPQQTLTFTDDKPVDNNMIKAFLQIYNYSLIHNKQKFDIIEK